MKVAPLSAGSTTLDLDSRTHVMGVLNITPDSFSDGGEFAQFDRAIEHGMAMEADGADIIDVGGESTRPGSARVSVEEELRRVVPVIEKLADSVNIPISIDTNKAVVAAAAIKAGATMVNDISGMTFDPEMGRVVADSELPVVIMHTADDPKVMQQTYVYGDVVEDLIAYFEGRLEAADKLGIANERIVLDPGIGFGKSVENNLDLIRSAGRFAESGCAVLIGPSRKAFIGALLDLPVNERLEGTLAAVAVSVMSGAHMVRVHDVGPVMRVCRICDAFLGKTVS